MHIESQAPISDRSRSLMSPVFIYKNRNSKELGDEIELILGSDERLTGNTGFHDQESCFI